MDAIRKSLEVERLVVPQADQGTLDLCGILLVRYHL
jgi:hypothetical protein